MAQRGKQTANKPAARPEAVLGRSRAAARSKPAASGLDRGSAGDRGSASDRERDDLKAALNTATARIQALEAAQTQVANRIGWMIEALQTLKDEGR